MGLVAQRHGGLPGLGIKLRSPALAGEFFTTDTWEAQIHIYPAKIPGSVIRRQRSEWILVDMDSFCVAIS